MSATNGGGVGDGERPHELFVARLQREIVEHEEMAVECRFIVDRGYRRMTGITVASAVNYLKIHDSLMQLQRAFVEVMGNRIAIAIEDGELDELDMDLVETYGADCEGMITDDDDDERSFEEVAKELDATLVEYALEKLGAESEFREEGRETWTAIRDTAREFLARGI